MGIRSSYTPEVVNDDDDLQMTIERGEFPHEPLLWCVCLKGIGRKSPMTPDVY